MKDDRILKPRLRLCPFCGASGAPELRKSGAVAFVHCNACRADGPVFGIDEYISNEFHDMCGADQDEDWRNATIAAQHDAMKAWNRRPWEGSYFPEELDDMEKRKKVIRCRECVYQEGSNADDETMFCYLDGRSAPDEGFCDRAEMRKDLKLKGGALYGSSVH